MDESGGSRRAGHSYVVVGLWDFACICTCMTYGFLWDGLCGMYVYDDGLEPEYVLFGVCMHVCVLNVFPH